MASNFKKFYQSCLKVVFAQEQIKIQDFELNLSALTFSIINPFQNLPLEQSYSVFVTYSPNKASGFVPFVHCTLSKHTSVFFLTMEHEWRVINSSRMPWNIVFNRNLCSAFWVYRLTLLRGSIFQLTRAAASEWDSRRCRCMSLGLITHTFGSALSFGLFEGAENLVTKEHEQFKATVQVLILWRVTLYKAFFSGRCVQSIAVSCNYLRLSLNEIYLLIHFAHRILHFKYSGSWYD